MSRAGRRRAGWLVPVMIAALLAAAGCESVADAAGGVRARLAAREEARVRTYAAPPRETYEALRQAAAQMGYRFVRGGPAQGEFEAVTAVRAGDTHGSARQIVMKVRLHGVREGTATEAAVRLSEVIEPDSSRRAGQAVAVPLRDTPQYHVLLERIAQILGPEKAGESGQKSR